jgi:UDP-N-acetylmuramyl pentapeptide phosphotransferase/UDP-N-acetylglucosamine-1-phosphate transferase
LDGFDGLAGAVSMVNVLILTYIFYVSKQDLFCQITVCLAGSLFAFLFYNKPTARVFMGDSGSLFLGMFFAFFSFYLNDNINNNHVAQNANINAVISYSFIALPVMDMFRLIIWRVKNRKHPFVGDNSHIHHLLSQMGLKPVMVLGVLVLLHITLIILSYLLKNVFIFTFIASTFIVYLILIKYIRYEIARRQLPKKDSHIGIKNQFINTGFLNDRALGSKLQDITPSEFPLNK